MGKIIHWAIVDTKGELMGPSACLKISSSMRSFNSCKPPSGYIKALLSFEDFHKLEDSFCSKRKIYQCCADVIESKATELSEGKKEINQHKAKPKYFRIYNDLYYETKDERGNITGSVRSFGL